MKFTESHEWIEVQGNIGTVGITQYAQKELGDIVYVELPQKKSIQAGEEAAVLESTKAAADVYSPVSGMILEVNTQLNEAPEKVNQSPENEGWIYKLQISQPAELEKLMDKSAYEAMLRKV